jgi:endoglucanase
MSGVTTETTTDAGGGLNVRAIDQNDWMEYNISPSTSGTYTFTFRVATIYTGAKFDVLNGAGKVLASVTVPNTGGAQTWTNVTASVALPSGAQTIMLYSKGTYRWNINYFTFGSASGTTAGTQATTQAVEEDATATQSMAISPNPFADRFVLTVNNPYTGTMKVQLIDASGVVRKEFQVLKNAAGTVQTYLSAGTLPAGNYFLKVQMENWSQTKQVVKL